MVANVFLLNYLIAILSTIYQEREDQGDFAYKQNKYQYIERYQIAMQDKSGYEELVLHPPPINYLIVLLIPSLFNQSSMERASRTFSKFIFWLENIFYIGMLLLYELMLVPVIYCKTFFTIL